MLHYFKKALERRKARRITREYPTYTDIFEIDGFGSVEFANWENPLVTPIKLNSNMVAFFNQFIKEGDTVIDIGANIGDTTVPMALCAGAPGLTLGFDPNPYVLKVLEKNASLNKDKTNIVPVPFAISVEEEEFYFISSEASFCNGGISKTTASRHGKFIIPEKVKGVNLKKYLEEHYADRMSRFSFIKIDTEGYDKEILKSIADLITQYKPVIIAESFGKATNEAKMELFEVIAQHGYDLFYFEDFNTQARVEPISKKEEITHWKHTINLYATPYN